MITTDRWVMYLVTLSRRKNLESLEKLNPPVCIISKLKQVMALLTSLYPAAFNFHFPQISNRINAKEVYKEEDRSLNIEVYRKPPHTDQYLLFGSHHQLEHKLGVIPYVAETSEKLRMIFNKHYILVHSKPTNTQKQKLVHPKDKTPGINRVMQFMLFSSVQYRKLYSSHTGNSVYSSQFN